MRRLVPFLLAALVASLPPSLLLVFIGGVGVSVGGLGGCAHHHGKNDRFDVAGIPRCHPGSPAASPAGSSSFGGGGGGGGVYASAYLHASAPTHHPMVDVAAAASIILGSGGGGSGGGGDRGVPPDSGGKRRSSPSQWASSLGVAAAASQLGHSIDDHQNAIYDDGSSAASGDSSHQLSSNNAVPKGLPPDTLKVSVLGTTRGKSDDCTYSMVEFSNTHHADAIIVHSTYIEPTAVFPPGSRPHHNKLDQPHVGTLPDSEYIQPSFHGEYHQDRHIHIPPRTAVTLPVSIIPHWRKDPPNNFGQSDNWSELPQHYDYRKLDANDEGSTGECGYSSRKNIRGVPSEPSSNFVSGGDSGDDAVEEEDSSLLVEADSDEPSGGNETLSSVFSSVIWADIISASQTSTLDFPTPPERYKFHLGATIHETLVANTSWGFVQMKVPYTCSPSHSLEYEYGLPNNLMFLDDGGGWYARRNTTATVELAWLFGDLGGTSHPTRQEGDPFLYRVYMNNPSGKELKIRRVFTTKPRLVGAVVQTAEEMTTSSMKQEQDARDFYPIKAGTHSASTRSNIYVASIRLYPKELVVHDITLQMLDLGFLEIHTNLGHFRIALDFIPNSERQSSSSGGGVIHGISDNHTTHGDIHLVQDDVISQWWDRMMLRKSWRPEDSPVSVLKSYTKVFERGADRLEKLASTRVSLESRQTNLGSPNSTSTSFMEVDPRVIDFGSITTGLRVIRVPVKVRNLHTLPLRIMRISFAMNTMSDDGMGNFTDISDEIKQMDVGIDWSSIYQDNSNILIDGPNVEWNQWRETPVQTTPTMKIVNFPHDLILPANNESEYTINVWCRFNANFATQDDKSTPTIVPRFYTGSILIQASDDLNITYRNWEKQLLVDYSTAWAMGGDQEHSSSSLTALPYVSELPFQGSVLPGNLGSPTEALLFPTHLHVLPLNGQNKTQTRANTEYYDRELSITNNFAVPISILKMSISDNRRGNDGSGSDDFCRSRFSINSYSRGGAYPTAKKGQLWKGLSVRYHYPVNGSDNNKWGISPVRKCVLSIETDRAGKQSLPLIIYSGELTVDIVRPEGGQLTVHCLVANEDGSFRLSTSGLPCMRDWVASSAEGAALEERILAVRDASLAKNSRKSSSVYPKLCTTQIDPFVDPIGAYFESLLSEPNAGEYAIQPIVLSFGAIPAGETASRSIVLTNMNHASVNVWAPTAEMNGMSVSMAVVPNSLTDAFRASTSVKAEEVASDDASYVLQHSPMAQDLFSKFRYRFDIQRSIRASGTELNALYTRHATSDAFSDYEYISSNYIEENWGEFGCSCGFMLATDGSYIMHDLSRKRQLQKKSWTIPPGGQAHLIVNVTAPEKGNLTSDVTPFVRTGLALETSHGQAMPIVMTFSAIAGRMQLRPQTEFKASPVANEEQYIRRVNLTDEEETQITVDVPLTLKDPILSSSVDSFAQRNGVALSIESTFAKDVYLKEVRSCNKWFNVFLPSDNAAARSFFSNNGVQNLLQIKGLDGFPDEVHEEDQSLRTAFPLGKVLSALSCSHPSGDKSFFACALAWLENRDQIQPPGCGLSEDDVIAMKTRCDATAENKVSDDGARKAEGKMKSLKTDTIGALRDVVAFLSARYNDGNKSGGYVHFSRIHMFRHARKAWKDFAALGLNAITGHIDAKTVYLDEKSTNSSKDHEGQGSVKHRAPLAIPVSSVLLKSSLDLPELFWGNRDEDSVGLVDFDAVHVADTTMRYVPLVNPTAMSIRVRLTAIDSADGSFGEDSMSKKNVFVQGSPNDHHPWWTGGSYWMSDSEGHLVTAGHNVTIRSGAGAYVSLLNPALHTMSAFLLGCGRRCGVRPNDNDHQSGEEKHFTPIGAASAEGSSLLGRPYDDSVPYVSQSEDVRTRMRVNALDIGDPPSFSLGLAADEVVIPPFGSAELGPVYFRPPGRSDYDGSIFIENSLTGFEEVKLRGRGGWEKLVFLDQQTEEDGGDVEFRFGQSTLVFPGSTGPHGAVVKSVRLANQGDVPARITSVYLTSSEVMHFTHKRRHPSSSFRSSSTSRDNRKCSARGFALPGCVEPYSSAWVETLVTWWTKIEEFLFGQDATVRNYADEMYKEGFTLQPNETRSIWIVHYPDCTFLTSYASVIFEIDGRSRPNTSRSQLGSWQQTFRKRKVELLVGYDMGHSEFAQCTPYFPPVSSSTSIWERKIEFQLPHLLQDILSFGLTRLTDASGNPYIPRHPIEMTLLAASFLLLLFALSLDLLFTVEVSANRKTSPGWKPTCRCLARADPNSSDLVTIGKEQTKHVLLGRFKKEGILPSQCVNFDGSLGRKTLNAAGSTHSEAIFDRFNLANDSQMSDMKNERNEVPGILPCGLKWRTAMSRGVGLPPTHRVDVTPGNSLEVKYFSRTRDRHLKRKQERKVIEAEKMANNVTLASTVPASATADVTNGKSTRNEVASDSLPQDKKVMPQQPTKSMQAPANGKGVAAKGNIKVGTSKQGGTNVGQPFISVRSGKNPSENSKAATATGKLKNQQISNVSQNPQKVKVVDAKSKQKQRPQDKSNRASRIETKTPRQDDSSSKQKVVSSGSTSRNRKEEKSLAERTFSSTSRKESHTNQTKQARQTKKTANGINGADKPKTKQGKQKVVPKRKSPPMPDSDILQLSPTPIPSPSASNRPNAEPQKCNFRPPPGLLAPPGFLNQPDLERVPTPSSPVTSPQRMSTFRSPVQRCIPNSPSLVSNTLESSLATNSPMGANSSDGSLSVKPFRQQSFTPPIVEPPQSTDTNVNAPYGDVQALLGAGSNFNVSNFLDGILGDSAPQQEQEQAPIMSEVVQKPVEEAESTLFQAGVSLDPWHSNSMSDGNGTNPLAALRGVAVEQQQQESSMIAGIPLTGNAPSLLAPSKTQSNIVTNTEEPEPAYAGIASIISDDNDEMLEPDSFYSKLLGEDFD